MGAELVLAESAIGVRNYRLRARYSGSDDCGRLVSKREAIHKRASRKFVGHDFANGNVVCRLLPDHEQRGSNPALLVLDVVSADPNRGHNEQDLVPLTWK